MSIVYLISHTTEHDSSCMQRTQWNTMKDRSMKNRTPPWVISASYVQVVITVLALHVAARTTRRLSCETFI